MNLALTQMAQKKIESAVKALNANRFDARFVPNREELLTLLGGMVPENAVVANGGSATLEETGVMDFIRSGKFRYLDRYRSGMTPEEIREIFVRSLDSDWYFTSSNAITMDGQLFNIDGNSNRVAAIAYGPRNVVVVAGANKLVQNLAEAESRVKNWSVAANCFRLNVNTTGCALTGKCTDCKSPDRMCCNTLISSFQRIPGRIKVFLLPETLGY
ncbi:lactate utilization protein [Caproiciproducens sp. NJN-50]|uniref:lactate utilization protein n=1 Tax=Acutalibacteraceae TaxID=3082771 RepID=UPI000FFE1CE7|nr:MULTISPECIES: lactate utilization protein [Acutalibacteraceae]QAT49594.1 lactate utilization protein [Caproiciproducens sp. NJN-50]